MHLIPLAYRVAMDAFYRFNADDGWAIASHIALSVLMSMFPFLILVTAIAGFIGSENLADRGGAHHHRSLAARGLRARSPAKSATC